MFHPQHGDLCGRSNKRNLSSGALRYAQGVGGFGLMVIVVLFVAVGCRRPPAQADNFSAAPTKVGEPAALPDLGPGTTIQPGILFQEAVLQSGPLPMRVWYYRPAQAKGKLPLVLVPPAGSTLIAGMKLSDGDRAEHYPYALAGFAVLSFDIDGHVPRDSTDDELFKGAREFRVSRAGLNNAKAALDYVLTKSPDVDPNRIFIAGHSSAATLALLVAEHESRIKGCVSYCGVSDVEARLATAIPELDEAIPGYREFLRFSSPKSHVESLKCPVFLFHSQSDAVVPVSQTTAFAALLKKTNKDVTVDTSARGDHYRSMIDAGIPKGIEWMQKR